MNTPAESTPREYRSYYFAVVVLVAGLLVYLWGHVKTMRQGEELVRLRGEREALIHRQDRLRVEVAGLQQSSRIRKIATEKLGMVFPSGAEIERRAGKSENLIELPYSVKGMDVSFSGMLTAALQLHKKGETVEDLSFSIQETAFAMLTEVTERAMAHTGIEEVLLGGGVAANKRLRGMLETMAEARGATFAVPPMKLCIDNGAMMAWLGLIMYEGGVRMDISDTLIKQRFRTDEVDVQWR